MELRNAVAAKFGIALPATVAFDFPTMHSLAAFVAQLVAPVEGPATLGQVGYVLQPRKYCDMLLLAAQLLH